MTPARRWGFAAAAVLVVLRVAAAFIHLDPGAPTGTPMAPPSAAHWLGTDPLGRDVAVRIIESSEAIVFPGLLATLLATVLAVPAGAALGYLPEGRWSAALRATLWLLASWPRLVVIVVTVAIFSRWAVDPAALASVRLYLVAAILGLTFVPAFAQGLEVRVRRFQAEDFVESAVAHGLSHWRILGVHILWANCRRFVGREWASLWGAWVLVETSLSYLGDYGVPPPRPSWGNLLSGVRSQVIAVKGLLVPDRADPAAWWEAVARAVGEGGLVQVVVPTILIVFTIGGLQALAASAEEEP